MPMTNIERPRTAVQSGPGNNDATNLRITEKNYSSGVIEINRLLPNDPEAEVGVLQACLADRGAVISARKYITHKDFYKLGGRLIFKMLTDFIESDRAYTPSLIISAFEGHPEFEHVEEFIVDAGPFVTGQTSAHFARIVREQAVRRNLIQILYHAMESCYDQSTAVEEVFDGLGLAVQEARGRMHHE